MVFVGRFRYYFMLYRFVGEKFDVTLDGRRLRPQRPEAGVVNRLSFIPIKDMVYSRYKFKSTSSEESQKEESQNLTDNSAELVRNHVKLLHVYKSRRGFSKGTVLCGGY